MLSTAALGSISRCIWTAPHFRLGICLLHNHFDHTSLYPERNWLRRYEGLPRSGCCCNDAYCSGYLGKHFPTRPYEGHCFWLLRSWCASRWHIWEYLRKGGRSLFRWPSSDNLQGGVVAQYLSVRRSATPSPKYTPC